MTEAMIDRLRELLRAARREAWDPWDWASWAPAEDPALVHLDVNVPVYNADFLVRANPDTIAELLDAHDRMAGALRRYIVALDRVNDPDDTDNTVDNFEAAVAELETMARAALAVPKEENPE